jgi:hypothetical protein
MKRINCIPVYAKAATLVAHVDVDATESRVVVTKMEDG